jgi:hypothetical protein
VEVPVILGEALRELLKSPSITRQFLVGRLARTFSKRPHHRSRFCKQAFVG